MCVFFLFILYHRAHRFCSLCILVCVCFTAFTFQFQNWTYLPTNTNKNWLNLVNWATERWDEQSQRYCGAHLTNLESFSPLNSIVLMKRKRQRMSSNGACPWWTWYKSISRNVIWFCQKQRETKDLKPIIQSSRRIHLPSTESIYIFWDVYVNARIYLISFMAFRFHGAMSFSFRLQQLKQQ